ncbi:MAG: hypothetical protein JXQ73_11935 [Phycisphaerae bacterium]|nr:hypothetical protein [Phycisphaerae bacterium]
MLPRTAAFCLPLLCAVTVSRAQQRLLLKDDFSASELNRELWEPHLPGTEGSFARIEDGALHILCRDAGGVLVPRVQVPPGHVVEFDYLQPSGERHGGYSNTVSCEVAEKAKGQDWGGAVWYVEESGHAWSHYGGRWGSRAGSDGRFPPLSDRWYRVRISNQEATTVIVLSDRESGEVVERWSMHHDPMVSGRVHFSAGASTPGSRWGFRLDNVRIFAAEGRFEPELAPLAKRRGIEPPEAWRPLNIAGRSFWHLAEYRLEVWKSWGLAEHPLFAEAAWLRAPNDEALLAKSGRPFVLRPAADDATRELQARIVADAGNRFLGFYDLVLGPGGPLNEWGDGLLRMDIKDHFGGPIADRNEGLQRLQRLYEDLADTVPVKRAVLALDGYRFFHHHAFKWGAQSVVAEVGENIPCMQLQLAATRGAARAFSKPWGIDLSSWYAGMVTDFRYTDDLLTAQSGPFSGHSMSLHKRMSYAAWLAGANELWFENCDLLSFAEEDILRIAGYEPRGVEGYRLSPVGVMAEQLFRLAAEKDRGAPYTPVALILDFAHGWSPKGCTPHLIWGRLPLSEGDHMLDEFFNTVYPWNPSRRYDGNAASACLMEAEQGYLAPSPFGDIFDVLTTETCDNLGDYPVAVLVGEVRVDPALARRLAGYVEAGGTLVINARQVGEHLPTGLLGATLTGQTTSASAARCSLDGAELPSEPFYYAAVSLRGATPLATAEDGGVLACTNSVGRGRVVLTTPFYLLTRDRKALPLLSHLLGHLCSGLSPVRVSSGVQYTVNRTADGWVIGLLNNQGVTKKALGRAAVRYEKALSVAVEFGGAVERVEEWVTDAAPGVTRNGERTTIRLEVPAGDVRVVHLVCGGEAASERLRRGP